MSGDDRDRVKAASDIVRVIGEQVELRARGREYVGLCPFHDDHKPSMAVVPAKQIFHCFSCGAGGDVFSFVMNYHRMEFPEALQMLADRAGIELAPRGRGGDRGGASRSVRATQAEANAFAMSFFRAILSHPEHGDAARSLIERRGISPEMVEAFSIGASPNRWDGLVKTLESKSHELKAFVDVGLLKRREGGGAGGGPGGSGCYDALRNRLVFPILDQAGRVVGFGGRRIDDEDEPKYLNSPESDLFKKSSTLYGLHAAARSIQKSGVAIVTEGYTDVIACHQAGVTNAVATLGTALTRDHAKILRRLCHTVVLLFDGDEAGGRAADRAVEVFFSEAVDVRIATLSSVGDAKDPDELLKREGGREVFDRAIDGAVDILDYRLETTRKRLSVSGVSRFEQAYEEEIRALAGLGLDRAKPVRRTRILQRLVELTGLGEREVVAALGSSVPRSFGPAPESAAPAAPTLTAVDRAVGAILRDASLLLGVDDRLADACGGLTVRVLDALRAGVSADSSDPLGEVLDELEGDPEGAAHAVRLERTVERETDSDESRARELFRAVMDSFSDGVGGSGRAGVSGEEHAGPVDLRDRLASMRRSESDRVSQARRLPRATPPGGGSGGSSGGGLPG